MEPLEEYHSPFDFEQGVNSSYLYLSPEYSDTPPSSPAVTSRGTAGGGAAWHSVCVCVCVDLGSLGGQQLREVGTDAVVWFSDN